MAESSTHPATVMTTVGLLLGQAGGGAVPDEQRRQSPELQTCQAGPEVEDAAKPLGHPSLGTDPRRKSSKTHNILLKLFLTSLLENCFLAVIQERLSSVPYTSMLQNALLIKALVQYALLQYATKCPIYKGSKSQISKYITKIFYD